MDLIHRNLKADAMRVKASIKCFKHLYVKYGHTLDERNPAPVHSLSMFIALFTGVLYIPGGCLAGFLTSTCGSNRFSLSFKCCGGTDDVEASGFLWASRLRYERVDG